MQIKMKEVVSLMLWMENWTIIMFLQLPLRLEVEETLVYSVVCLPLCIKVQYTISVKKKKKKNPVKSDQFFSGEQYFSPSNNFTRIELTPSKNFIG